MAASATATTRATTPAGRVRTGLTPRRRRNGATVYILPAVLVVVALLYAPFLYTIWLSFTDKQGAGPASFAGFENYVEYLTSWNFLEALRNTLLWVVGTIVLPVGLGLVIALFTYGTRRASASRFPFLLPYALSGAAVGVVFGFILRPEGALGQALDFFGLPGGDTSWLLTGPGNTIMMIIAASWHSVGVNALLFVVGLQAIPREPIEAAMLDGASGWRLFRHVTWPLLTPLTTVVVALAMVASLKTFDIVWVMTQGGPGRSSETLAVSMYRETFVIQKYGYGSAVAVVLSVVAIVVSMSYLRRQFRRIGG